MKTAEFHSIQWSKLLLFSDDKISSIQTRHFNLERKTGTFWNNETSIKHLKLELAENPAWTVTWIRFCVCTFIYPRRHFACLLSRTTELKPGFANILVRYCSEKEGYNAHIFSQNSKWTHCANTSMSCFSSTKTLHDTCISTSNL